MARRKHKKKLPLAADPAALAHPQWAKFRTAYHGQGAHVDKSRYNRKHKHKEQSDGDE
jgi:hypothetical protein